MVRQGHVNIQRLLLVDDTPTILISYIDVNT
jgi:hypothetical protein